MTDYNLQKITWTDSYTPKSGWNGINELPEIKDNICISIGYIIKETDKHVVICPHISDITEQEEYNMFDGVFIIPKCSIIKRWTLKETK